MLEVQGLKSKYPAFDYPVVGEEKIRDLGLITDEDTLWTKDEREKQKHQVRDRMNMDVN